MHTFVIGEIGSCHDGSLDKALRLIDIAKACGADAAKFQFWSSSARMAKRRNAPEYEQIYEAGRVPVEWLARLKLRCEAASIDFMCSTYLPEDVEIVAPYVQAFKIASFEANDPQHLVAHVKPSKGKTVYISMGMGARLDVIERYFRVPSVAENGGGDAQVVLLHCVSAYPAPIDQLNLMRLRWDFDRRYQVDTRVGVLPQLHGFSDHSDPAQTLIGAFAVAAGAIVVERHLRADDTDPANADYGHAMAPAAFAQYVEHIRLAERALEGPDYRTRQVGSVDAEQPMRAYRVIDRD